MPIIYILGQNAQIKEFVIEPLVFAVVSLVMKVSLANVLYAQIIAMIAEHVGLKSI